MSPSLLTIAPKRKFFAVLTIALWTISLAGCHPFLRLDSKKPSTSAPVAPEPVAQALVAYLFEGQIWTISATGGEPRKLEAGEETIDEFIWSPDGTALYATVGLRLLSISVKDGAKQQIGVISAPEGTTIDRLQKTRRDNVLIVHTSDANALPHLFSYSLETHESRELTVDEYSALTTIQSPSVRAFSDLSVSPDVLRVLYKVAVGTNEQLFVADVERGPAAQITNLGTLEGFEESAETEGGRRIIEAEWAPDARHILFVPAQSCSDAGLCYGQLFVADSWAGGERRLSQGMMVGLDVSWDWSGKHLLFEDAGKIMFTNFPTGETKLLAEGNRAKWQPVKPKVI